MLVLIIAGLFVFFVGISLVEVIAERDWPRATWGWAALMGLALLLAIAQ